MKNSIVLLCFFLLSCNETLEPMADNLECYIGKMGLSKITEDNNSYEIVVSTILVNNSLDTICISWKEDSLSLNNYPSSYLHGILKSWQEGCFSFFPLVYSPVRGVIGHDTLSFSARLWNRNIAPQDTVPMVLVFHRYLTEEDSEALLRKLDDMQFIFEQDAEDAIKEISFRRSSKNKLFYGEDGSYGFKLTKKKRGETYDY